MYAIVETGGKQVKVTPGEIIQVEKLVANEGDVITLNDVLFIGDENTLRVGTPYLQDTIVRAKVLSHERSKKVLVFKLKKRKNYRRKIGHRQSFTRLKIEEIVLNPQ